MLKKQIKKSLLEIKEKKETLLIEEKIIKSRISMILGDIKSEEDFHKLSEAQQFKMSVSILEELSYLQSSNLITEQDFFSSLKNLFGGWTGSIGQTIFEPFVNKIISAIGIPDGYLKNVMVSFLTSNPAEVIRGFRDCKVMTKLVSRSIIEGFAMLQQDKMKKPGAFYDFLRNQIGTFLESAGFIEKIELHIGGFICGLFGKLTKNTEEIAAKLKPATVNAIT